MEDFWTGSSDLVEVYKEESGDSLSTEGIRRMINYWWWEGGPQLENGAVIPCVFNF